MVLGQVYKLVEGLKVSVVLLKSGFYSLSLNYIYIYIFFSGIQIKQNFNGISISVLGNYDQLAISKILCRSNYSDYHFSFAAVNGNMFILLLGING